MTHISRVRIKNWIGIDELDVDLSKINFLKGKTGSGKTSFIEALEKAFTNKSRRVEVVKHGENEATIFVQTSDGLEIDRKIRAGEKADYLKIRKSGQAVPSTEKFLRQLISGDIFKPLEFIKKTADEQAKIILNMLDIPWTKENIIEWFGELPQVSYDAHILQILKQIEKQYFDEREVINREIKTLEAQVKGIRDELPQNYNGEEWKEKKIQEYYSKVAEAEENNKKIQTAQALIDNLEARIKSIENQSNLDVIEKEKEFNDQTKSILETIGKLEKNIEEGKLVIQNTELKIQEEIEKIDIELKLEVEKLKAEYDKKKNTAKETLQDKANKAREYIARAEQTIVSNKKEIENINILKHESISSIVKITDEKKKTVQAEAGNAKKILEKLEFIDTTPLKEDADYVAEMQSYIRDYDRAQDIIKNRLDPKKDQSKELTLKIEKARELPRQLLKTAGVPIKGLTVDEDGCIRIGQTLISDLSEGEQLELGFRVAKVQCGDLKVICLDGINKINAADRERLNKEIHSDEYQYFILETVDGDLNIEIGGDI